MSKKNYEFKKRIEELSKYRGRGTELISVYITPGYPISDVTGKLKDEYGQASNIKSKSTQKNVQAALEKIMHFLKSFKQTPKNGMAVFAGNVSEKEGKQDLQLFWVEPPQPLNVQFYRCESQFVLEPLEELADKTDLYGLVVMDGKDATLAFLKGTQTKVVKKLHSTAHQKVHKGGQSAARFDRLHVEGVELYYKRVGRAMDAFVDKKNFKGVILGGPGPAKHDFLKMKPFNYQLKILGVVDMGYTDEYGLREIVEKSSEIIADQEAVKEKQLFDSFMREVSTNGLALYGPIEIKRALDARQVEKLLVTQGLELFYVKLKCNSCNKEEEKLVEKIGEESCSCGGKLVVTKDENVVAELVEEAERQGVPIEYLSQDTSEGAQFYGTFRGLGAFLRYK
ncbi:peptide chain release factor 1 [Candidatus Micrarchaeota archaeon CG_4_10_14_0_2_um_filter_55_9]|nr:MAG: peptide chain release factor 1 [Candidatus Micrarchaeota archaeon CG1_02_55_41]PIZ91379.1 MAG: peptide chain release factor 1 [Candidatus Micrarchaeota archaeon CG_4_10_14_0_2_um_filter_55_9]PJD01102.1 MAG: peptide chain release factor 1 [Candidatus Micrarchaeota archaeon CG10_big_fil_rev_8_21_14_0_10_54_18]